MFEVARRFRQLKEKYITDITESQNEEKCVMCKMDFLQPHLESHSPTPNNQSSEFVFEFVDIQKKSIITTENTVWSSYGISLGKTLSNLNHKAACSLRHSIETIIFTELNENLFVFYLFLFEFFDWLTIQIKIWQCLDINTLTFVLF
jgi:hypothetical protein